MTIALAGTTAGTLMAVVLAPALRSLVPTGVPRADEISVNPWLLAFAVCAAAMTTVLAALAPAWRGGRVDLISTLKRSVGAVSADGASARWRQALIGVQSGVATALLISTALLLISFWRLGRVPLGFDGEKVLTVEMRLLDSKYAAPPPPPGHPPQPGQFTLPLAVFQDELEDRLRALPGVVDVGLTSAVPFRGVDFTYVLNRVGHRERHVAKARIVDAGYFSVMRVHATAGRLLSDVDRAGSLKTVVISESYAREVFGAENPIGQAIDFYGPTTVVGVVPDLRYEGFDQEARPAVYVPRAQDPIELVCVVMRTAPGAGDAVPAIRRVIREIDPALPAMNFATIDQIIDESVADRRFYASASTVFAGLALVLTMVGLVVVVSRAVAERRRELAIRTAIGATTSSLIVLVAGQALRPVLVGTTIGAAIAYAAATTLDRFLFHVDPREPVVYGGVMLTLAGLAAVTSVIASRRIATNPVAAVLRLD
jgi:predicted permease